MAAIEDKASTEQVHTHPKTPRDRPRPETARCLLRPYSSPFNSSQKRSPFAPLLSLSRARPLSLTSTTSPLASRLSPLARQLAKSWIVSYIGNFVGSVAFAYLVFLGGTLGPAGGASVMHAPNARLA